MATDESLVALESHAAAGELASRLVLDSTGEQVELQRLQGQGNLDLRQVFGSIHAALVAIIEASNASRLEAMEAQDEVAQRIQALGLSMDAVEEETSRAAAAADYCAAQCGTRFCIQYKEEEDVEYAFENAEGSDEEDDLFDEEPLQDGVNSRTTVTSTAKRASKPRSRGSQEGTASEEYKPTTAFQFTPSQAQKIEKVEESVPEAKPVKVEDKGEKENTITSKGAEFTEEANATTMEKSGKDSAKLKKGTSILKESEMERPKSTERPKSVERPKTTSRPATVSDEGPGEIIEFQSWEEWEQTRSRRASTRVTRVSLGAHRSTRTMRSTIMRSTTLQDHRKSRKSRSTRRGTESTRRLQTQKSIAFEIVQEELEENDEPSTPSSPVSGKNRGFGRNKSRKDLNDKPSADAELEDDSATLSATVESRLTGFEEKIADLEFLCNVVQKRVKEDVMKVQDVERIAKGIVDESISKLQIRQTIKSKLDPVMQELQNIKDLQTKTLGIADDSQAREEQAKQRAEDLAMIDSNAQRAAEFEQAVNMRLDSAEEESSLLREEITNLRERLDETKEAEAELLEMNRTWTDGLGALKEEIRGEIGELAMSMESTQSGGQGKWVTDKTLASSDAEEMLNLRSELNEETRRRQEHQKYTSRQTELTEHQLRSYKDSLDALWWRLSKKGVVDMQDGLDKGIRDALNDKANCLEVMKLEAEAKKMGKTVKHLVEQTRRMQEQWDDAPDCIVGVKCLSCNHHAEQMRVAGALELLAADRHDALMRSGQRAVRPLCTSTEPLPDVFASEATPCDDTMKMPDTAAMSKTWHSKSLPSLQKGPKSTKTPKKLRALLDAGQRVPGRSLADGP